MTGAAHEKCQNLSFLQAGQFAGRRTLIPEARHWIEPANGAGTQG